MPSSSDLPCSSCGHYNATTAKFCNECGERFLANTSAAQDQILRTPAPTFIRSSPVQYEREAKHEVELPVQKMKTTHERYKGDELIELPAEGEAVSFSFYTQQLSKIGFPESTRAISRPCEIAQGFTLGATRSNCGGSIHLSAQMNGENRLFRLTCAFFSQQRADFLPTSFYFLKDTHCICHTDAHNDSHTSLISGFGDYEGGELCSFSPGGIHSTQVDLPPGKSLRSPSGALLRAGEMVDAHILPIREQVQEFDGKYPHQTQPYRLGIGPLAHRWVVVAYRVDGWKEMTMAHSLTLADGGLHWLKQISASPIRSLAMKRQELSHSDVVQHVKGQLLLERTSLAKLGTGQAHAPEFGTGRAIVIHGHCQSGKSREICLCAWLSYFAYDTVPYIFVMNSGGLGILPQMNKAIENFNAEVDKIIKELYGGRCSKIALLKYNLVPTDGSFNPKLADKAQVMLRLGNGGKVRAIREHEAPLIDDTFGRKNGKYAITMILDEGDLHIQSGSRSRGVLEKEWQQPMSEGAAFLASCFQEINLTATINAFALTGTSPIITLKLPLPGNYIGLARDARAAPLVKLGNTDKVEDDLPEQLCNMLQDMLDDPRLNRVGLIQCGKLRTHHTALQEKIVEKYDASSKLVVLNHNSGHLNDQGGVDMAQQAFGISALATSFNSFAEYFQQGLAEKIDGGVSIDSNGRVHFKRRRSVSKEAEGFAVGDVMSILAQMRHHTAFSVLIISGHSGCRGMCFKDKDHCEDPASAMHLTDMFYSFPDTTSGEAIVQTASRICGIYHQQPMLRLWTSRKEYGLIMQKHDEISNVFALLSQNPEVPPREVLATTRLEAFFALPQGSGSRIRKPQTVRSKIEQNVWCSNADVGPSFLFKRPRKRKVELLSDDDDDDDDDDAKQ